MGLFAWRKRNEDISKTYSLDGIEKVNYAEIDQVMDCLKFIGSAMALFHIKDSVVRATPMDKRLCEFTDGWTVAQVEKTSSGTVELMNMLTKESEEPFHANGTLQIINGRLIGGALLTMNDTAINYPLGGISYTTPAGHTHTRALQRRRATTFTSNGKSTAYRKWLPFPHGPLTCRVDRSVFP